jgi:putative FmdB family regulatory protein
MPIYAYRCEACGFTKDALQKLSDAPLTECPSCHQQTFKKQVTAAGFQLKGTGWYVTDFRGGNSGSNAAATSTESTSGTVSSGSNSSEAAAGTASAASAGSTSTTETAKPAAKEGSNTSSLS